MASSRRELAALLSAFFVLAVVYAWAIPYFESSDEISHFEFVKRLVLEGGQLPVVTRGAYWSAEEHQPPAYYLLSALVGWALLSGPFWETLGKMSLIFYGARGVSILFGMGTVVGAYLLSCHFFGPRRLLRIAATAIVVFNPSLIAIMGAVTNDSMAAAVGIFLLLATVKVAAAPRLSLGHLLAVGLLTGLAAITKENLLMSLAPLAISLWVMARRTPSLRYLLLVLAAVGLPAVALGGWWYARNWALYGDPLAWNVNALLSPGNVRRELPGLNSYLAVVNTLAQTYWVGLGRALGVRAPMPVYLVIWAGCTAALLGLYRHWRSKHQEDWLPSGHRLGVALLAAAIALLFLADMNYNRAFVGAGSGRYFFPVAGAIAVLVTLGLSSVVRTRISWPVVAFCVLVSALGVAAPIVYLLPLRVIPRVVTEAELRSQAQPVHAVFDRTLQLVGYQISNPRVMPGENLQVSLYWKAIADTTLIWTNYVHVIDSKNNMYGQYDSIPLKESYPTLFWKKGEIWRDDIDVRVEPGAPNGYYRLEVGFYSLQTEEGALVSAQGREWVGGLPLGQVRVVAPERVPQLGNPLTVDFQGSIRLVGWDRDGGRVTLYWQSASPITGTFTVFVHFLGRDSRVVAQHDGWPAMGRMPTFIWEPGEVIRDDHPVIAPPGVYALEVGLYDSTTLERVPLLAGGSSLLLGPVRVP